MGGVICDTCWFRKTTTGEETHNTFRDDLNEGDCIITKKPCGHEWRGHGNCVQCETMRDFYRDGRKPPKPKREKPDHGFEQLKLF